jgi:hypothetical protein
MADLSYFGKNQSAPTDNFSEGVGSLREVLTENYPSSSSTLDLARRAYSLTEELVNRRIQEQMGDLEFLKELEDRSGIELSKGRGSVLASLGYYGSPDPRSDEGTASISHYSSPWTYETLGPGEEFLTGGNRTTGWYIPKTYGFNKKLREVFGQGSRLSPKEQEEQKDKLAKYFKKEGVKFSGELPSAGGIALTDSDLYERLSRDYKDWTKRTQKVSPGLIDILQGNDRSPHSAELGQKQGNTFRHEARHRGVDSDAFKELKASLRGAHPTSREFKLLNTVSRIMADIDYEHDIYDLLRQLDQGQVTYEELSEKEQDRLDRFESMENALLDSFTERERLKLGLGFEEGGEVNSLAGVSAPYVYGIPESERGGSLVEFLSQFFPGRREVLKPSEVEWKDDPNIRYVPQTPFRRQEKDVGFNPETGEFVSRGEFIPGIYGETEYALEYMPAVRALQNLQSAYIKHVLSPGQFERAVNIIKGAPSAIGNALIGQWAAIGTPPGTAALTPFTGETVYSASVLPPVGRATEVSKVASRALAPRTEMITPEGFSFPVPPPPPPTTMQMTKGGDKTPPLPSEKLLATKPVEPLASTPVKAPEEQLGLFEEAAQIKPQQPTAGSLFDEKKGRKLLIVGCCETKSKVEELIPASERYKGPLFTTLNKAGVPEDVDVAVLSAKHGLIRFDTPLEDYNVKMKDGRKDLLNSPEQLARINNTVDGYGEVFVAGGKDYRNFLDEAGIKGKYTTYTDHRKPRGIGDQRSILAKWLKREKVEKPKPESKKVEELRPGERVSIKGKAGVFYLDRPLPNGWLRIRDDEQPNPRFIKVRKEDVSSAGYYYAGGGGINSLAEIARNMTRYANGGALIH